MIGVSDEWARCQASFCSVLSMQYSSLTERLRGLGSQRWEIHLRAVQRRSAGDDIVMLSIGEPDSPTPPAIVDAAVASLRAGRTHYSPSQGEPGVLEAIAHRYATRAGRPVSAAQAIFMPGSHTALYAVCHAVLDAGDDLLVPEPYYAAYDAIFRSTRATVVPVALRPEERFHVQMDVLESVITPTARALILNNPHNPTGAVLSPKRVRQIAEFCRDRDLWLISDEVYEDLVYEGRFASPFDLEEFAERVVVVSSVSKSHAMTGWRCGWAVGPEALIARVRDVSEAMMFGGQPFLQDATAVALSERFDECEDMYADYRRRALLVAGAFSESGVVHCHLPEAGIFVMVDIRASGLTGVEFASRLLDEHDVASMPGESFGPSGAGHIRLSLTTDDEAITLGCQRILRFAESVAG